MVDSLTMFDCIDHKINIKFKNGKTIKGLVDFYESEWDSGCGEATIGLKGNGTWFVQSDIESIEIIDD